MVDGLLDGFKEGIRMEPQKASAMAPSKDAMKDRRMAGAMASWSVLSLDNK
jgi:hypothetical protein